MLSVGNGVSNNVLKEDLEDTSGLLVDEAATGNVSRRFMDKT